MLTHVRRPAQEGVQEWKARIAIRSRNELGAADPARPSATAHTLAPYLCYVCHTTLTSKGTRALPILYPSIANSSATITVPSWTSSHMRENQVLSVEGDATAEEPVLVSHRKMGQEELRQALDGFILDD